MNQPATALPPLHDGFLRGFLVEDQRVRLFLHTVDGEPYTVTLADVRSFHVDGFAEGNIILDCEVLPAADVSTDVLVSLNHGGTRNEAIEQLCALVENGTHSVFRIFPSYGATVVALFKTFTVSSGIPSA